MRRICLWAFVLVAVGTGAMAQGFSGSPQDRRPSQEPLPTAWQLFLEQDSVLSPGTDKDYTMGFQLTFSGWKLRRSPILRTIFAKPLSFFDSAVANRFHELACVDAPPSGAPQTTAPLCKVQGGQRGYQSHAFAFGGTAFTPRKGDPRQDGPDCKHRGCVLALTTPVYDDRPYAFLLYGTFRRSTAIGKWATTSDFTLAMLGLQLGKVVQTAIHDPLTDPGGWKYQISNGGEPTLNYRFGFKRLLGAGFIHKLPSGDRDWAGSDPTDASDDKWFDLTADFGASVGLYTKASAGMTVRLGFLDSAYWSSDRQPVFFTRNPTRAKKAARVPEAFVWAAAGYDLWAYNGLLQGQFRESPVTLSFRPKASDPNYNSPLNRAIWDWEFGGTVRLRNWFATYRFTRYRNLFEGPHKRNHAYWGIYLGRGNADPAGS